MGELGTQIVWWLLLVIAGLYSIYILIELFQGETTAFKQFGFGQSVGVEPIRRRNEPVRYWLIMAVRMGAQVGMWMCWWALWSGFEN